MLFYGHQIISSILVSPLLTKNGDSCYSHPQKNTYNVNIFSCINSVNPCVLLTDIPVQVVSLNFSWKNQ